MAEQEEKNPQKISFKHFTGGALAALVTFGMAANVMFVDEFSTSRLSALLGAALVIQILLSGRMSCCCEIKIYSILLLFAITSLTWTPNPTLGLNSIFPMLNFLLIMALYNSVANFYSMRSILEGSLIGFLIGAAVCTTKLKFPFEYPEEFSYNAFATMYLFGMFLSIMLSVLLPQKKFPLAIGLLAAAHVLLTTSIKANFGVAIGYVAWLVYNRGTLLKKFRKKAIILTTLIGVIVYVHHVDIVLPEHLDYTFKRLATGVEVLQAQSDIPGYSGFEERQNWAEQAFSDISNNPFIGSGIEAFRAKYGITSHSTPVDLTYNLGLFGLILFYAVFISMTLRVFRLKKTTYRPFLGIICGTLACLIFMSLSGTFFYNTYVAAILGISISILKSAKSKLKKATI